MNTPGEKPPMAVGGNESSTASAQDKDSSSSIRPSGAVSEDLYPHGFKLAILAGSSLIAVFLIALDQVTHPYIRLRRHVSHELYL
jgi:hypothetical protein